MEKPTFLMKPGTVNGFATAHAPSALPPGLVSSLSNARLGDGSVRARFGDVSIVGGLTSPPRGAFECSLDGTQYLFRTEAAGGKITVKASTDGGATWPTTVTPSSGAYGDTRLTDSSTSPVRFCVVRDNPPLSFEAYDCLVIQNGTDAPRIFAKAVTGSSAFTPGNFGCSIVTQPATPSGTTNTLYVLQQFSHPATVAGAGGTTYPAPTGTGLTLADTASGTANNTILATVTTLYVAASTASVVFLAALDFTGRSAAVAVVRAPTTDFWSQMQIEIGDNAGHWDILSQNYSELLTGPGSNSYYQLLLILPTSTTVTLAAVDRVRMTWLGATPSGANKTGELLMFAVEGNLTATTQFGVAYGGTDSRTIGPMTPLETVKGAKISQNNGAVTLSSVALSTNPVFLYDFILGIPNTTNAQRDAGIDRFFLYRRDDGETNYYLEGSKRVATWGGASWAFASGSAGSLVSVSTPLTDTADLSRPGLSADALVLPTGAAMAFANARTWVGSGQRLYVSDVDAPWVFRKAADVEDAGSGTSIGFAGQTVETIVPLGAFGAAAEDLSTPVAGVATVFVLTDRNLWELSGFTVDSLSRPIPRAPYGTLSPLSVGRSRLGFYWLTDRNQIAYMSPQGLDLISLSMVDDQLAAIPSAMKAWTVGAVANDRYYLGYTTSGSSNNKLLVWYERLRTWESIDTASAGSFEFLVPYYASGYLKLLRFGSSTLYEHEVPGSTATVAFSVTFPELASFEKRVAATDMAIAMDSTPSTPISLTTSRYFPDTGSSSAGTISFTPDTHRAWQLDNMGAGGSGWTVQPSFSGTVPGGTRFYSASILLRFIDQGPNRA